MMEAKDLRIGNYITLFDIGKTECISVIGKNVIQVENGMGNVFKCEICKPIPLTEEWLLRFGFYQKLGVMCWEKDEIEIVYESIAKFYRFYPRTYSIKYVHQIQNLYFALTGTELELK